MRGGEIRRFGCCVSGTGAGFCTLRYCGRCKLSTREGGSDFFGTLGDDAGVNVVNGSIGGREITCLCYKHGECARGGYMIAKSCDSCFSAACCTSPTM